MLIKRYGPPGLLDTAEYKTKCMVESGGEIDLYMQNSKKEERPNWEFIGTFSKKELKNKLEEYK